MAKACKQHDGACPMCQTRSEAEGPRLCVCGLIACTKCTLTIDGKNVCSKCDGIQAAKAKLQDLRKVANEFMKEGNTGDFADARLAVAAERSGVGDVNIEDSDAESDPGEGLGSQPQGDPPASPSQSTSDAAVTVPQ